MRECKTNLPGGMAERLLVDSVAQRQHKMAQAVDVKRARAKDAFQQLQANLYMEAKHKPNLAI